MTDSPAPAREKGLQSCEPRGGVSSQGSGRSSLDHTTCPPSQARRRPSALGSLLGPPLPRPLALKNACLPLSQLQGKKSYFKSDKNNGKIPRHLGNRPALPHRHPLTQAGDRQHTSLHRAPAHHQPLQTHHAGTPAPGQAHLQAVPPPPPAESIPNQITTQ